MTEKEQIKAARKVIDLVINASDEDLLLAMTLLESQKLEELFMVIGSQTAEHMDKEFEKEAKRINSIKECITSLRFIENKTEKEKSVINELTGIRIKRQDSLNKHSTKLENLIFFLDSLFRKKNIPDCQHPEIIKYSYATFDTVKIKVRD